MQGCHSSGSFLAHSGGFGVLSPWKIRRPCYHARGCSNQLAHRRGAHGRACCLGSRFHRIPVRSCRSRFLTRPSPVILSLLVILFMVFLCFSCPSCRTSESHLSGFFCPQDTHATLVPVSVHTSTCTQHAFQWLVTQCSRHPF